MPIEIIRQDITKIKCDAIVCPTNSNLIADGGVDLLIHKIAGKKLDLECEKIKPIEVGKAKITKGYNLPSKYIIHTVGPIYQDGSHNERELLESCYKNAFKLATFFKCKSIAFPLISSGTYGYPREQVLRLAHNILSQLVSEDEIQVYIVVYDKDSYSISEKLFTDITDFIGDNYVMETSNKMLSDSALGGRAIARKRANDISREQVLLDKCASYDDIASLDDLLKNMDKSFAETLFYYIDKKGISDIDAYKKANVDKKTFSKIKCNKDYRPSKKTAVSFAIALRLNKTETEHLLKTAGMALSRSNLFDVIIEYFITTGNYNNIYDVNEALYKFDQATLGV